ncbi:MAG: phosphatase PAP2 family protein [Proteobacteria bacterium]|nr:phosphatase PAP2 family protein [Pseudomonadota bacterium]NIS71708.1 phosphatase PAP2 family protein [Pseudomonadota bacterium]
MAYKLKDIKEENLKGPERKAKAHLIAQSPNMRPLELVDYSFFLYLAMIFLLIAYFSRKTSITLWHLSIHGGYFAMGALILLMNARRPNGVTFFCRTWYVPFLYVFLFEEVGQLIHLFRPIMFDHWVVSLENSVFGGYPTAWLQGMANPWITEVMSLFYMTYYFLIPVLGFMFYFGRELNPLNDFIFTTSITFFFCFLHYLAMPVAGPIFLPQVLPFPLVLLQGGPLTRFEQWLFFKGAIQGGAFPSSHVAVAVVVLFFAIRYGKYAYAFALTITGLAISTVYNGYHYGVDVIYGIGVGLVFSLVCPWVNRAWRSASVSKR